MKHDLSIYLIAGNEEAYIERCLKSFAPAAKEMVVCIARGSATPDKTEEIALAHGARVIHYKNKKTDWPFIDNFAEARNLALQACSCEFQAWVDADDIMADDGVATIEYAIDELIKRDGHLVALKYWVENAALCPLREEISRKGTCEWRNRVHETLVAHDPSKMFGLDKIWRIHKPHGYKKTSADRNFKILEDELKGTPHALYYQQQEYFLSGQHAKAIESGKRALAFPDLDETLKYDVLLNLGRCHAEESERLKYLGQAMTCQPERREAYYYAALLYASKGQWQKAWGSARCAISLPRPSTHYWNLQEPVYRWQTLDIYRTASMCIGNTAEIENANKAWTNPPKITMVHATRGRQNIAYQRRFQWLSLAKDPLSIEWLFMVDHDDPTDYTPHGAIRCNPGGIINAWNEGAKRAKGEIIVQMSDDWSPPRNWDALISTAIGDTKAEKVLAVSDGHRQDKLLCMAILTQSRLKKQGHLFHPSYQESDGIYSDNEFTQRAYDDGVVIEAKDIVLTHENPIFTGAKQDDNFKNHNKPEHYEKGKAIYEKRKASNWPL